MNLAFTLAVGDKKWGELALNWVLSVKSANPKAKTALIYDPSAIQGNEEYLEYFFDYMIRITGEYESATEFAFRTKTNLCDIITKAVDAEAYLFMDADSLMLSGRSVDEFFSELSDVQITMWCNDVYDFETQSRMRDDYTFWCDVEQDYIFFLKTGKIPQVNSSFIYFKKSDAAMAVFEIAFSFMGRKDLPVFKPYKGAIPDELCFNLAFLLDNQLPHQIPYYPIFFTFSGSNFEEQYIRNWKAIGFAGDEKQHPALVHLYQHNVNYYRKQFGIAENFETENALQIKPKDEKPMYIKPVSKRTLFRRGEVINSDGGVFNPDGLYENGRYFTIYRKEKNHDFYEVGHNQATGIPHISILSETANDDYELVMSDFPVNARIEDFRIVTGSFEKNKFMVTFSMVFNNFKKNMQIRIGNAWVYPMRKTMFFISEITLPIEQNGIEKNWVLFLEGDTTYCIYSLNPYRIFKFSNSNSRWEEMAVKQPEIDWFHKNKMICNSTRPVKVGNEYVMLFHTKQAGVFFQGAVIIDAETKDVTHYTKRSIPIKEYAEGFQPDLIYVSGLCYIEDRNILRVYYGEADSHSCYNDYKADEFIAMVKQTKV